MKTVIHTTDAPDPIGPYSQAVKHGNTLFLSGQIAIDPKSGTMVMNDIPSETHQVMKNIAAVLKASGTEFSNVIKTSIFLKNMDDFAQVNDVYGSYFTGDYPARETVAVLTLPKDVNVEISMVVAV